MFLFNFCVLLSLSYALSQEYNFKQNGTEWLETYPECGGSEQSPVDINSDDVSYYLNKDWEQLDFSGIETMPTNMTLTNDGRKLVIDFEWPEDGPPILTGGPFYDSKYALDTVHFHWASEHTVQGKMFPIEIHFTYYNTSYESFGEALAYKNGVAAVAIFMKVGKKSEALAKVLENAPNSLEPDETVNITPFPNVVFRSDTAQSQYLTYYGSQVIPPCSEVIIWIISQDILEASEEQLNIITSTTLDNGDDHNNRATQPANGRRLAYITSTHAQST